MEWSKADTKEKCPNGLNYNNHNTIIINNFLVFYKRWNKYNETQLTKDKMDVNNLKMKNHPPSPVRRAYRNKMIPFSKVLEDVELIFLILLST